MKNLKEMSIDDISRFRSFWSGRKKVTDLDRREAAVLQNSLAEMKSQRKMLDLLTSRRTTVANPVVGEDIGP